ncbi:hypothetical protein, conserved [Trypanosoma brucei brucei TREU927]|uniref:PPIase cyclophilin-type domain-containing protein n=1 Tax=Trypanosoma brucei brucei (strain 927/4 GUTat10.1) TaxID=185431 RepID=Q4GZ47_TRYB2|nr:hypothetical protein, conserved [Trypanosoma brucei brucei TREU927]CAJ16182.1 hypothetical protein, conserved [Trypanosoma brucei brucei TREU927]
MCDLFSSSSVFSFCSSAFERFSMQATLGFAFPHPQRKQQVYEISITVFVPAPETRPRTVANFYYMCTGELPPTYPTYGAVVGNNNTVCGALPSLEAIKSNASLKPFEGSAVVRIEKGVVLEIGSSTTKTIFGGFTEDESSPLAKESASVGASKAAAGRQSVSASMQELRAGTLLIGNMGIPNSNGSRYYILLQDASVNERKAEFSPYKPLGFVISGMEALQAACASVAVHPRTLVPTQKVKMLVSEVHFRRSVMQPAEAMAKQRLANIAPTAGRTRCRDEFEGSEIAKEGLDSNTSVFFDHTRKFPLWGNESHGGANGESGGNLPQAKRPRTERVVSNDDGSVSLRKTAVEGPAGEPFDYMAAQEAVFLNDIDLIAETQAVRHRRRAKRQQKKRKHAGSGQSKSAGADNSKKGKHAVPPSGGGKVLRRRY